MKIFKHILPYFRPYLPGVIAGLLFVLLTNVFKVAGPWILRYAINGLETGITAAKLWNSAGLILAVALLSGVFRFLMRKVLIGISRHIEYDLRRDLFHHLLLLEPAFYDRSRIGDLMTRLTSDVERVRMVIGPALMYTANTLFGLAFSLILMLKISPLLTSTVVFIVPIVIGLVTYLGKRIHRSSTLTQEAFSDLSAMVQEHLSGIRIVKSFRQENNQARKFDEKSRSFFKRSFHLNLLQGVFFPVIMLVFGISSVGILLVGGYLIIKGKILVGDFVVFFSYLMILSWPLVSIGWVVGLVQRGAASLKRLVELFDRRSALPVPADPVRLERISGEIAMEGVTLVYPETDTPVLHKVSFRVKPGGTLGVVGRVGSGKSSIVSLIPRLYDPQEGAITLDGVDISRLDPADLRAAIGVVPQDPFLFSATIRDNITLGNEEYSEEEISAALEVSRLVQDLTEFPEGLETEVGERGITLSGGQKQRVAIARAIIRKPLILLFDDALSAVDSDTEEKIIANLRQYLEKRTAIIVSHRVSSVLHSDEIIVLDKGEVVQRGRHNELVSRPGMYADLFRRQQIARELGDSP